MHNQTHFRLKQMIVLNTTGNTPNSLICYEKDIVLNLCSELITISTNGNIVI